MTNYFYLQEIWDNAITNQDNTTNFFVLLAEELEREMKEGDTDALSSELADFIIKKGGL